MKNLMIFLTMISLFLTGCMTGSLKKEYVDDSYTQNMIVNLDMKDDGFMTSLDAVAGINDFDKNCKVKYRGAVRLSQGKNSIGLRPKQHTNFVVEITRSHLNQEGTTLASAYIKPVSGKKYEFDVSYINGMFDYKLYEMTRKGRKELKIVHWSVCKKPGSKSNSF